MTCARERSRLARNKGALSQGAPSRHRLRPDTLLRIRSYTIGINREAIQTTPKPDIPIRVSMTENVLRVSPSVIPDILEITQNPLSFIQGPGLDPQPMASAR